MKLSILIPIYNEEKTLREILEVVENIDIGEIEKELILVNDCSADKSAEILKDYEEHTVVHHEKNMGKGAAIRTAIGHATGDFVVVQDADLEYDPKEFKMLLQPLIEDKADVVYGSRFLSRQNKAKYELFSLGNKALSLATTILYFKRITDMETCYKMFKKDVIKGITIKSNGFDMEPEITAKILKKGYRVLEMPITYVGRSMEEGKKITVWDGIKALFVLIKYRFVN